jgi:hypothetical protein
MRAVRTMGQPLLSLLVALVIALSLAVAWGAAPATASSTGGGTSGCDPYLDGTVIPVPCSAGSGSAGSRGGSGNNGSSGGGSDGSGSDGSGSGGSGSGGSAGSSTTSSSCQTVVLSNAGAQNLGLPGPPPQDKSWGLLDCLGGRGPVAVLVSKATGVPAVTPQQLLVTAFGELQIPYIGPDTAPPRGHDGLVGLPEWFWVPSGRWYARSVTVRAGEVWATVTAAPVSLTFEPGGGISAVTCLGPGTAYDPREPADAQHTECAYTYLLPSIGQTGDAYRASVTVTWRVSWTGSGGASGVLDRALPVSVDFTIPVAQGEALVTNP